MNFLLLLCLTLITRYSSIVSGQQCLDLMPPFAPTVPLRFCDQYSKYGCCTSLDDERLREIHDDITSINQQIDGRRQTSLICLPYVKAFLCARCSPFSAELFQDIVTQSDNLRMPRIFPGLCNGFCTHFYDSCVDGVLQDYLEVIGNTEKRMERAMFLSSLTSSSNSGMFCEAVALPPNKSQYCHPIVDSTFGESSKLTTDKVNTAECVCLQSYNIFLRNPVVITNANDCTDRLFITEQIGVVKIMFSDGSISQNDFLNIQSKVYQDGNGFSQLGLLGMTFHPEFKDNKKLYVFYTFKKSSTSDLYIRVEEYRVMDTDADRVDPSTSRVILEIQKGSVNHAGGQLLFGKDGYLYIFTGDDADATIMEEEKSQDMFSYSGKVLRVNVDVPDLVAGREYSIPSDNPFADDEELALPEIYAWGLRNPWRCSVDRGMLTQLAYYTNAYKKTSVCFGYSTHPKTRQSKSEERIFCGDAGADTFEEINIIKSRENYGWNIKEGTADMCTDCLRGLPEVSFTDPIFQYRTSIGVVVIGGNMYRGCLNPNLYDQYIFGDYTNGLYRLKENSQDQTWAGERLEICPASQCLFPLDSEIQPHILAFGEDEYGEIYVLTHSSPSLTSPNGRVYKIVDPIRRGNPKRCKSARPVDGLSAVTGDFLPNVTPCRSKEEPSSRVTPQTSVPRRQRRPVSGPRRRTGGPRRVGNQRPRSRSRFNFLRRLFNRRCNRRKLDNRAGRRS